MKKIISIGLLILLCINVQAQKKSSSGSDANFALGIRLGTLNGLSLKKYMGGGKALELSLGRTYYYGRYNGYYNSRYRYDRYFDRRYDGKGWKYLYTYDFNPPISIQLHYLIHKDIKQLSGLKWYYGFGGQFRSASYYVRYRYQINGNSFEANERVSDIGVGADGVIGLEYTFKEVPLSIFTDATLYMEIFDYPFWFDGQAGIGIRYNF